MNHVRRIAMMITEGHHRAEAIQILTNYEEAISRPYEDVDSDTQIRDVTEYFAKDLSDEFGINGDIHHATIQICTNTDLELLASAIWSTYQDENGEIMASILVYGPDAKIFANYLVHGINSSGEEIEDGRLFLDDVAHKIYGDDVMTVHGNFSYSNGQLQQQHNDIGPGSLFSSLFPEFHNDHHHEYEEDEYHEDDDLGPSGLFPEYHEDDEEDDDGNGLSVYEYP